MSPAMLPGYPRVPAQPGWIGLLTSADFHEGVGEGNATAPFGEGVVGQRVGDHRVGVMLVPPAPRDRDETGSKAIGDLRRHFDPGAGGEDPRVLDVEDAAFGSVVGAHLQERTRLAPAVARKVR